MFDPATAEKASDAPAWMSPARRSVLAATSDRDLVEHFAAIEQRVARGDLSRDELDAIAADLDAIRARMVERTADLLRLQAIVDRRRRHIG